MSAQDLALVMFMFASSSVLRCCKVIFCKYVYVRVCVREREGLGRDATVIKSQFTRFYGGRRALKKEERVPSSC